MSREIKFEYIWQNGTSVAKGVYTIEDIEIGTVTPPKSNGVCWDLIARRQYTGLKDAKGVEIYEGDIVMCYPDEIELSYTKVVEWDNESPSLGITTNGRSGATLCKGNQGILLIIGNIHQNPELLGE